jgi:hypothetical protein
LQQSQYLDAQPFWPPWIVGRPPAPTLPPVLATPPVFGDPPVFGVPPLPFTPPDELPPAPPLHAPHDRAQVPSIQSAPHQP